LGKEFIELRNGIYLNKGFNQSIFKKNQESIIPTLKYYITSTNSKTFRNLKEDQFDRKYLKNN